MTKSFLMDITKIQPSQLYINSRKLAQVQKKFVPLTLQTIPPVPIKKLNERVFFTDGHTRAFAAYLKGFENLYVEWDEDDLDWDLYKVCLDWCDKEGILTIADLKNRVIDNQYYQILWLNRCKEIQNKIKLKRNRIK